MVSACLLRELRHEVENIFCSGKTGLSVEKYNHFSPRTFVLIDVLN